MSSELGGPSFKFFGGPVGLDFANSLNWRLTAAPVELIPDYEALLAWSRSRGTLTNQALATLERRAAGDPAAAAALIRRMHDFRAEVIAILNELRSGGRPSLDPLNDALSEMPAQPALLRDERRLVFDLPGADLREPLWPILWSLSAVLAAGDGDRIGSCQADGCGWFFVDESPNGSRLWCSDGCGNRERVRRNAAKRRLRAS